MRKRLLISGSCALVGVVVAWPVSDYCGVSLPLALAGCGLGGVVIGYAVSALVDVLFGETGEEPEN